MQPAIIYQEEWVKILAKGLITIPKSFRDELGLKEGEVAKVKKIGKRLIIEPRELSNYESYSNIEYKEMLDNDKLPKKLANLTSSMWPDIT